MVANKDIEMPNGCISVTTRPFYSDELVYDYCPFYNTCDHAEFSEVNVRPNDCPLVEIVTCSECNNWEGNNFGTGYCSIKKKYKRSYDYCSEAQRRVDDSY